MTEGMDIRIKGGPYDGQSMHVLKKEPNSNVAYIGAIGNMQGVPVYTDSDGIVYVNWKDIVGDRQAN